MAQAERKKGGAGHNLLLLIVAAVLVFLGTLLGECGLGTGLGPGLRDRLPDAPPNASVAPTSTVAPTPTASAEAPAACQLRLDREGVKLDGQSVSIAEAVEACKNAGKAELITTGDARYGDHEQLRAALQEAGVFVLERTL